MIQEDFPAWPVSRRVTETIEIRPVLSGFVVSRTARGITASQMAADLYDALARMDIYLRPEWKHEGGNC